MGLVVMLSRARFRVGEIAVALAELEELVDRARGRQATERESSGPGSRMPGSPTSAEGWIRVRRRRSSTR